ncbi:protein mesh-like [Paramacrobiotus metropolitanus]|uniref:protein mesh-like n=1 Tax=Paramacrobiotus metropolitanus TaxID=2943436 RepID=UPI00244593B8|nr:protein mesh-like [Paramacrobiotus metropolitanus]
MERWMWLSVFLSVVLCYAYAQMFPQNLPPQSPMNNPFARPPGGAAAPITWNSRPLTTGQRPNQERYPDLRNPYMPQEYRRDPLLYSYGHEWGDKSPERRGGVTEQVNIPFRLPFYGGVYNYTIVATDGFIAFAPPPHGTSNNPQFPNPRYPQERDHPFIAPFYSKTGFTRRSNVFYRTVAKGQIASTAPGLQEQQRKQYYENDLILEMALRDIRFGIIGAEEFVPIAGFLVTWSNLTFEGKAFDDDKLETEPVPENTFQLLVVTDEEARTYAIFNYKEVSWTTHSGAYGDVHTGLGGHPARVGFNGGNGTGFWELAPFSRDTRLAQIDERSNVDFTGRYIFRVDEVIQPAGCVEGVYQGMAYAAPSGGSMLGGEMINVTGPCFLPSSQIRCKFGQYETQGIYLNPVQAKCITPMMFEAGWREFGVSVDGGRTYNFRGEFFVVQHGRVSPSIQLRAIDDWFLENPPTQLTLEWNPRNMTWADGLQIDIGIWGYREKSDNPEIQFLANIATNVPNNNGRYQFDPHGLTPGNFHAIFTYGFLRINATDTSGASSAEYPHLWSETIPLAWYFRKQWRNTIGDDYAGQFCRDWYYGDRVLPQFIGYLEPCPCTLAQAQADKGRFLPDFECDYDGRSTCNLHKEAIHCVHGPVHPFNGAGQECCYDREGNIHLTHDKKWGGSPNRAHPWGVIPYRESRKVPSLSNWFHDNMPWFFCCHWSDNCDYYGQYRRVSHDCVGYHPPGAAIIFGDPHVITFDNIHYGFHGKGDYVLLKSDLRQFLINVQARLEQPPRQSFGLINATVIRAVAMKENDSDVVEIQARESHKRWRYRLQILVNGQPRYFDRPWLKLQTFKGVSIHSPEFNLDQSNLVVRFPSGIGVEVQEVQGYLHVTSYVPREIQNHTYGLFGNWSGIPEDDLKTANGIEVPVSSNPRAIYQDFAKTWQVQNNPITGSSLFQYRTYRGDLMTNTGNPNERGEEWFPVFDEPQYPPANTTLKMSEVEQLCGPPIPENRECRYDYLVTANRHIAEATAQAKINFTAMRNNGLRPVLSCGAIFTPKYGIKEGYRITSGASSTFTCMDGYYLYGTAQWKCLPDEGRWTYGELPYCMSYGEWSRWVAGTAMGIVLAVLIPAVTVILLCLSRKRSDSSGRSGAETRALNSRPATSSELPTVHKKTTTVITSYDTKEESPTSKKSTMEADNNVKTAIYTKPAKDISPPYRPKAYSPPGAGRGPRETSA